MRQNKFSLWFTQFAKTTSRAAGRPSAFIAAGAVIVIWIVTGPLFHFSDTWQLVINTGTTIVTFLMVFLIQKSQNKDSLAIQLKLNELVAAHEFASNRLVNIENITEDELKVIQKYYIQLSELSKKSQSLQESHSIDEAKELHQKKTLARESGKLEPAKD